MRIAHYIRQLKPYEGGKPIEELRRELGIEGRIVKLASNENPLGPPKKAIDAIKQAADRVNFYPDGDCFYLKEKLAKKLGVSKENLIFGNGSDELIELIYRTFATDDNDEILYCYPTFIEYKIIGMSFGKKLVEVPLKDYAYDIESLAEKINNRTRIIFLNTPNNPTGTVIKRNDIEWVIKTAKSDTIVVIDEAYYEYAQSEEDYDDLTDLYEKDNVIILRTFSKAYGLAGLRIGYGISNKTLIDYLNRVRPPFNVNLIAQNAAMAALDDKEHLEKSLEVNRKGKEFLYKEFDRLGIKYIKTYANFILFDVNRDAEEVYKKLLTRGVIVRPMSGFGLKTMLRVTIGTQQANEMFIANLEEIMNDR